MSQLDWNATIHSVRESISQTQFKNWLEPLAYLRSDHQAVVLGVPSRFHEDWVKQHYGALLKKIIHKQCGTELQLEFEILSSNADATASVEQPTRQKLGIETPPTFKPALRLLTSTTPDDESDSQPFFPPPKPQLPSFKHPYFEVAFNRIAHQFAQAFAEGTQPHLNPYIISGGVGSGKSHLLSLIGEKVLELNPNATVRYISAESFTGEMVQGFKTNQSMAFKQKYRFETTVLLFDDIQVLSGRLRTQEEVLHILNEMTVSGCRVAFTCSVPIHRLENFIEPLKSRLLSAVVGEIKTPTFEDRVELLSLTAHHSQIDTDDTTLRTLADHGQKNVRELIGTLFRVHLQAQLENRPLDTSFLASEDCTPPPQKQAITMSEILALVEHNFGIAREEIVSKSRKGVTTWARQVAMYLARHHTLHSLEEIGKTLGRDHATVIHAFQKVKEAMEAHPQKKYEVEFLQQKLRSQSPEKDHT